jgi:hypothetical protein
MRRLAPLLALAACGGPSAAPSTAAAPPDAPDPGAPIRAAPVVPAPPLSALTPDGAGCRWDKLDPRAATPGAPIARFDVADCFGGRIAWSPDLARALVWFDPDNVASAGFAAAGTPAPGHPDEPTRATPPRLFEVDLATGATRELALPKLPEPALELALGPDGAWAFAERELPGKVAGRTTKVEGRALDFAEHMDGMPGAALGYRLDGDRWTLREVAATSLGWDYAAGWSAAPAAETLGPRSIELLDPRLGGDELGDPALATALAALGGGVATDGDGWVAVPGEPPQPPLYTWQVTGEFSYPTGRLAWRTTDGGVARLPDLGFTGGEIVAVLRAGRYALVVAPRAGTTPRLYDLEARTLVYRSEAARAVTFWPAVRNYRPPGR